MHQLLPVPGEVDPVEAYLAAPRPAPAGRPWVTVGMISSLDGASTDPDGRSGGLGGPADQAVLRAVRAVADVVIAGAGTVRAEGYGPVRASAEVRAARVAAGRDPSPPRLAVVSGRLDLDPSAPCFADAPVRPIVFTVDDADRRAAGALSDVADVEAAGTDRVEAERVLAILRERDAEVVVSEGGPTWNGALVRSGLVDELCLTLSPYVVGGTSARIVDCADTAPTTFELASLLTADDLLFGRWTRTTALSRT